MGILERVSPSEREWVEQNLRVPRSIPNHRFVVAAADNDQFRFPIAVVASGSFSS